MRGVRDGNVREPTQEQFLKDVAAHHVVVLRDEGLYRHVRFHNPSCSWNQWFEIMTWPHRLVYTGDMGTFVFTRLEDMFEFFRSKPGDDGELYINTSYWAEKLLAVDRSCRGRGASETEFSIERFRKLVDEEVSSRIVEWDLNATAQAELRAAIKEMYLGFEEDDERGAYAALSNFSCKVGAWTFKFEDAWEWNCRSFTYRFVWCCYALAWAIQKYDGCVAPLSPRATKEVFHVQV